MSSQKENCEKKEVDELSTMEALIESVRGYPILYNLQHPDYKIVGKKEIAWLNVSMETNQTVSWCKSKWKYLRDAYKAKKAGLKGKSGDAAKRVTQWAYFWMLSFLDDYIKDAVTSGNIQVEDESSCDDGVVGINQEVPGASLSNLVPTPTKKRKTESGDPVDAALVKYLSSQTESKTEIHDSHYHFGMDLAEQLRKLPPDAAAWVKLKVHEALFEVQKKLSHANQQTITQAK